jgi:hypothetical protein
LFSEEGVKNVKSITIIDFKIFLAPEAIFRIIEVFLEETHKLEVLADSNFVLKIDVSFQELLDRKVAVAIPIHALTSCVELILCDSHVTVEVKHSCHFVGSHS